MPTPHRSTTRCSWLDALPAEFAFLLALPLVVAVAALAGESVRAARRRRRQSTIRTTPGKIGQVGHARIDAGLLHQRRDLAAVVRRVLEEVRRARSTPAAGAACRRTTRGTRASRRATRRRARRPSPGCRGRRPRARGERGELGMRVRAVRGHRVRLAGEAPEPHAVAPQDVRERAVDRAEERAAIALALVVAASWRAPRTSARSSSGCSARGAGSTRRRSRRRGRRGRLREVAQVLPRDSSSPISIDAASCASRATTPYA